MWRSHPQLADLRTPADSACADKRRGAPTAWPADPPSASRTLSRSATITFKLALTKRGLGALPPVQLPGYHRAVPLYDGAGKLLIVERIQSPWIGALVPGSGDEPDERAELKALISESPGLAANNPARDTSSASGGRDCPQGLRRWGGT